MEFKLYQKKSLICVETVRDCTFPNIYPQLRVKNIQVV